MIRFCFFFKKKIEKVKATFIMYFFKKKLKIPDEINGHLLGKFIANQIFEIDRHLFHKFASQKPKK